jgi:hypothetical protein
MMGLTYTPDHPARSFVRGCVLTNGPSSPPWEKPPSEPIRLTIKKGREDAPLPTFLREPVPLMNNRLLSVLRSAGVDNFDVYRAELHYEDGALASDAYYVFNLIGLVQAADLDKPAFAVDPRAARGLLMFRLAENVSTILVHEKIKRAIEAAHLPLIRVLKTEDVAML